MKQGNELVFTLFGDFHYREGFWPTKVSDLDTILNSALEEDSDFVLHTGDFCTNYVGSPEITTRYLDFSLPTYGVMGNHELETEGNTVEYVTPKLTNSEVHWGTADEKVGDGYIAYYWFEKKGIRFVCTDSNYTYNPEKEIWERNTSFLPKQGNLYRSCLGEKQLEWLDKVLTDAAEKKIPCVIVSHAHYHPTWDLDYDPTLRAGDSEKVRAIFEKVNKIQKGTVMMAINGHVHSNRIEQVDNILYLDVISPLVGWWKRYETDHYKPEHKITLENYDDDGNYIGSKEISVTELMLAKCSNFYEKPLYTTVRICDGKISVKPMEGKWLYDIRPVNNELVENPIEIPKGDPDYSKRVEIMEPRITGGEFYIER